MFVKLNGRKKLLLKESAETLITAVVLALVIRFFIIQPYKIPTGSMEPTLMPGDRILVLRYIYGMRVPFTYKRFLRFKTPQVGDIVVFNYPLDQKRAFIKRCMATGGDEITIENGSVWLNGKPFRAPSTNKIYYYNRGKYAAEGHTLTVPEESYFVLGDNSASSQDSRYWGFLDDKFVIGKAVIIYWPLKRIRLLK